MVIMEPSKTLVAGGEMSQERELQICVVLNPDIKIKLISWQQGSSSFTVRHLNKISMSALLCLFIK